MNKTRLAEKGYRDKLKNIRLNTTKNHKKQKKTEKVKKVVKSTIVEYRKQKRQQNYKKNNMN